MNNTNDNNINNNINNNNNNNDNTERAWRSSNKHDDDHNDEHKQRGSTAKLCSSQVRVTSEHGKVTWFTMTRTTASRAEQEQKNANITVVNNKQ